MTYTDSVDAATGVRMVKTDQTTTPNPRMSFAVNLVARYPPHIFVTVYPTKKTLQEVAPGQQEALQVGGCAMHACKHFTLCCRTESTADTGHLQVANSRTVAACNALCYKQHAGGDHAGP